MNESSLLLFRIDYRFNSKGLELELFVYKHKIVSIIKNDIIRTEYIKDLNFF